MKEYSKILLILVLPLLLVLVYSLCGKTYSFNVEKLDLGDTFSYKELADTDSVVKTTKAVEHVDTVPLDTAKQRIMLFGDSMVEGLGPRLAQYGNANGHDVTYVCWYSSNTTLWATDTLKYYLRKADPTFVLVTLGGNEQQSRDLRKCEENIKKILADVGDIPYIWICTPAWKLDAPFNAVPERLAGKKHFFDSRKLTFERGKDHHHPTFSSASVWMDSIAAWMQSQNSPHPIIMKRPPEGTSKKCHSIYLQPAS